MPLTLKWMWISQTAPRELYYCYCNRWRWCCLSPSCENRMVCLFFYCSAVGVFWPLPRPCLLFVVLLFFHAFHCLSLSKFVSLRLLHFLLPPVQVYFSVRALPCDCHIWNVALSVSYCFIFKQRRTKTASDWYSCVTFLNFGWLKEKIYHRSCYKSTLCS